MHIMHVIDRLAVGGAERMLVDIANQSTLEGYRVSVCITRTGGDLMKELAPSISVVELRRKKRFSILPLFRLAREARQNRVDALHVHGRTSFSLISLGVLLRLKLPPVILHDHYGRIDIDTSVPFWFRAAVRLFPFTYVGVYRKLAEWAIQAGVPQERIHVIGNALDLNRFVELNKEARQTRDKHPIKKRPQSINRPAILSLIPEGIPVGIAAAGIRPEKGFHVLLNALASMNFPGSYRLIMAGGDRDIEYAAQCRNMIETHHLNDKVIWAGEIKDLPNLLHSVDFAVIPSLSESGPLALIEYLIADLPFVATRTGEICARVEESNLPEFVPPGNVHALADSLVRLLSLSRKERLERGRRGREIAREMFDIQNVMPHWRSVYAAAEGHRVRTFATGFA